MSDFLSRASTAIMLWTVLLVISFLSKPCCAEKAINLPFGDVNVVVVTDVHSWVAGHGRHAEEHLDADYGDVLSFYERLQKDCQKYGRDLWFVMNGDFMDGTGLSTRPPKALLPILEKMPWDAVNVGNHELYDSETIDYVSQPGGFIDWFGERYLSSNSIHASTGKPLGHRYRILKGRNSSILTFGFLFNMKNSSPIVLVEEVEKVVQADWFVNALINETFDAIMVLAHMDVHDPLVDIILSSIRKKIGHEMPVQFITGHSHYRGYEKLDTYSTSFEAGRYLDTVGFVSFPTKDSIAAIQEGNGNESTNEEATTGIFSHRFLDANVITLQETLGVSNLKTKSGKALSTLIHATQESMGLTKLVGCAPITFYEWHPLSKTDSIWGLYAQQVVPTQLFRNHSTSVLLQSKGSIRYSLFKGEITLDDLVAVDPFNDTIFLIAKDVPGRVILELNSTLNPSNQQYMFNGKIFESSLPNYILSGDVIQDRKYDLYTQEYDAKPIQKVLANVFSGNMVMQSTNRTVGSLWFSFVEQFWSCDYNQEVLNSSTEVTIQKYRIVDTHSSRTSAAIVALCFLSSAVISFQIRSKRSEYSRI